MWLIPVHSRAYPPPGRRLIPAVAALALFGAGATVWADTAPQEPTTGCLRIVGSEDRGFCPLLHTDVEANVAGMIGRVRVKQIFANPSDSKIEAIYAFPLPAGAAVDAMIMNVGDRRIVGDIKERSAAREIYEQAKAAGHVASLLDQQRPNIFTQSVANIEPGVQVEIEIHYVETLSYEDGRFEWVFPMVVGPRYIPGGGSAPAPMTTGRDTPQVPDGSRISPPVVPPGKRAGHDISLAVTIDGGSAERRPIDLESTLHDISVTSTRCPGATRVQLRNEKEIPNRDFVLHYRLGSEDLEDAYVVHTDDRGTYFMLALQPPKRVQAEQVVPRELIFVLDTSGSMSGFPINKAKAVMAKAIDTMRPGDTFNLITFAGSTRVLWERPRPNTEANRQEAQAFLASRSGRGGTEMMKAIEAALKQRKGEARSALSLLALADLPADGRSVIVDVEFDQVGEAHNPTAGGWEYRFDVADGIALRARSEKPLPPTRTDPRGSVFRLTGEWQTVGGRRLLAFSDAQVVPRYEPVSAMRIVCFMTDGYVGNDMAIIDAVKRHADTTRVFSFGIGNSVNRFLLDGMASVGRGEVEYVTLQSDGDAAAQRFHERILSPVLTDIAVDWGGLPVEDIYPKRVPDLFAAKPIMIHGRLRQPANGRITLRGQTGAGPFERTIEARSSVRSSGEAAHPSVATLWARQKVESLLARDYAAVQHDTLPEDLQSAVVNLGLTFKLVTQFTSFVAVEEMTVTSGGKPVTVRVPVEMPDGVSHEGVFGGAGGFGAGAGRGQHLFNNSVQAAAPIPSPMARKRGALAPRATPAPARLAAGQRRSDVAETKAESARDRALTPTEKLSDVLRKVAEAVRKADFGGDATIDGVTITGHRVDVMIRLTDANEETIRKLEALGFRKSAESRTIALVIGSADARRLLELAALNEVTSIRAVESR